MTISATAQGLRPGVCTSTSRPSAPFDGQVIYETDTNTLAVYDGSGWVSLNPVDRDRNVVINGAMQIAQRNTSVASISGGTYNTADRWFYNAANSPGTWTQSVENDAPTGSGFRKSLKMLCTSANASLDAGDFVAIEQRIEGQNVQKFKKGTSSAERFTLSFWVKSNVTGTYVAELQDTDNSRAANQQYSVLSANTWEKKTLTFPADTTGEFTNDSGESLKLRFWLVAGSTYTSGSLLSSWGTNTSANLAVGQVNVSASTNNYWQVTGVQLEVGAVATPFEFEDYGTTLSKCQRYYQEAVLEGSGYGGSSGSFLVTYPFPTQMRGTPTITQAANNVNYTAANVTATTSTYIADEKHVSSYRSCSSTGNTQFSEKVTLAIEL